MKAFTTVLSVAEIHAARAFYEDLFGLELYQDYGRNLTFTCGLSLQQDFHWLTGLSRAQIHPQPNNMELAFETEDLDGFLQKLRAYPHLKGNFGTAWQNQQKELPAFPGAVLFTTNCIQDPKDYADKVFTSGNVSWPGLVHCKGRDFSAVIRKALELPGFAEDVPGKEVLTGFGRETLLGAAPAVLDAVAQGKLRHIFLVGGCDGARPGRNYYTEFVRQTPADTVVLTLACGKYRFNDLDLGAIGGLPRLMDVGQCNDAYSAIQIAVALADAFGCGVNDLPLSMVLSWYEQKAVCILLTLLHLGIKNIRLGPTLPAFVSPNVLNYLVENFGIAPITTPEEDLKQLLK